MTTATSDHRRAMESTYGDLLIPALPISQLSCPTCRGARSVEYQLCRACDTTKTHARPARLGFCLYVIKGQQLYRYLLDYKNPRFGRFAQDARNLIRGLVYIALNEHMRCLQYLQGPVDAWCVVPSLRQDEETHSRTHPLASIVRDVVMKRAPELDIRTTPASTTRQHQPEHYHPNLHTIPNHVLVVEDTWVTGSHVRSLASALTTAGVKQVSVLTLARLIDPSFPPALPLVDQITTAHREHGVLWPCPWTTTGHCPDPRR